MQIILFFICVICVVHNAKVQHYFYIASDILKKLKKFGPCHNAQAAIILCLEFEPWPSCGDFFSMTWKAIAHSDTPAVPAPDAS